MKNMNKRGNTNQNFSKLISPKGKKGLEMATGTIIAIVLGIIILVIMIIFAQQQVTKSSKKLDTFGDQAEISYDKCQSILTGRICAASCTNGYQQVPPPPGRWSDCGKTIKDKSNCCEKI